MSIDSGKWRGLRGAHRAPDLCLLASGVFIFGVLFGVGLLNAGGVAFGKIMRASGYAFCPSYTVDMTANV